MDDAVEDRRHIAHVHDGENRVEHLALLAVVLACRAKDLGETSSLLWRTYLASRTKLAQKSNGSTYDTRRGRPVLSDYAVTYLINHDVSSYVCWSLTMILFRALGS